MTLQNSIAHRLLKLYRFFFFNPFPNKPFCLRVCRTSLLKTLWEKEKLLITGNFSFLYPSKTGCIMGSTVAGWRTGGWAASHSSSGAYFQGYASYSYEISWVDRSHQGGVRCTETVTLA